MTNFVSFIIIFITFFNLILFLVSLMERYFYNSTNIFKFKVYNFYISIFFSILYIFIFVILMYILRLFNINKIINCHKIIYDIHRIWLITLSDIDFILQITIIIFLIFIICLTFIIILFIQKYCLSHIKKIYFYITKDLDKSSKFYKILDKLRDIGQQVIITALIIDIGYRLQLFLENQVKKNKLSLSKFEFLKKYLRYRYYLLHTRRYIHFFPLSIIIYDLIFNNYMIINLQYCLIIYIPIIILMQITTFMAGGHANDVRKIFFSIYYEKQNPTKIYAFHPAMKPFIDKFVQDNLTTGTLELCDIMFALSFQLEFELLELENNIYGNNEGQKLVLTFEGAFEYIEETEYNEELDTMSIEEMKEKFKKDKNFILYKINKKKGIKYFVITDNEKYH